MKFEKLTAQREAAWRGALLAVLLLSHGCLKATGPDARPNGAIRVLPPIAAIAEREAEVRIEKIAEVALPASAIHLAIGGDALYVSMSLNGLAVCDVADPARPRLVHHQPGIVDPEDRDARIVLACLPEEDRLLVADRFHGLSVYDLTDPFRPVPSWDLRLPGDVGDRPVSISRVDDTYYLCCGGAGLRVLPLDFGPETEAPAVLDQFDHTIGAVPMSPHWLLVSDGYMTGMQVLDIRDPRRPRSVHQFQTGTYCDQVVPIGRYAVLSNRQYGFTILDMSDPTEPFVANLHSTTPHTGPAIKSMALWRDRYLLVGDVMKRIDVYDFADPPRPVHVLQFETEAEVNTMTLDGDLLYVGLWRRNAVGIYRLSTGSETP